MQKDYKLHIQSDPRLLSDKEAEDQEFRMLMLEPRVTSLASTFMGRVISGKSEGPDAKKKPKAQSFIEQTAENKALFARLAGVTNTPSAKAFAIFADDNRKRRNGDVHDTTDAALKASAAQLKRAGAVRLLQHKLPWQCAIIDKMDELLACLSEPAGKD